MIRYFKQVILLELVCIAYSIIHNYNFISQVAMFLAAALMIMASLFLYWQCFTNKELSKKQKWIGLIVASIPIIVIIGWLAFVAFALFFGVH